MSSSLQLSRDNIYVRQLSKPIMTCQTTANCGGTQGLGGGGGSVVRVGVQILSGHDLVGETLSDISFRLYKAGSPSGNGEVKIYASDDTLKGTSSSTIDWATLPTSAGTSSSFDIPDIVIAAGDRIVITGGSYNGSNEVNLCISSDDEYDYQNGTKFQTAWTDQTGDSASFCYNEAVPPPPESSTLLFPPPVAYI